MNAMSSTQHPQRGMATLAITLMLLFAMSLATLFVNRIFILHQRSSTNEYRAAQAFEAAEAGLSWATTLLNDPRTLDDACLPKANSRSFRDRYSPIGGFSPESHPGCRLSDGALSCSCPGASAQPSWKGQQQPVFTLSFAIVPGSPDSVLVTAQGCTSAASPCIAGSDVGSADAASQLSAVLTLTPLIRVIPGAALSAGGDVSLTGTARLQNRDRTTNGALVDAGGLTTVEAQVELTSLPGAPAATAITENDATLSATPANGSVFNAFFGMSSQQFSTATAVRQIRADSPSARAAALMTDYALGYSAFEVNGSLQFDGPAIGTPDRPVLIVSPASVGCDSPCQLNGLIYHDTPLRNPSGGAMIETHGALISRGEHRQSSGESVVYDLDVLKTLRRQTQSFVRKPGSWHDL